MNNIKAYLKDKLDSFLSLSPYYTEKDAINDHSVGRYRYAVQLIQEGGDTNLVKAFVWLSLAADEVDMKKEAGRLKHQVGYELKKRELFEKALELENDYRQKYSAEALRKQIENSYNPLHILLRLGIGYIEKVAKLAEYIDMNLLKGRGSHFYWSMVMMILSVIPLWAFFTFKLHFYTVVLIIMVLMLMSIISVICEKRAEDK